LASAQWSLFHLQQLENEEIEAFVTLLPTHWSMPVRQFLRNLQTGGAFTLRLLQMKTMNGNQKMFIPPLAIDTEFFISLRTCKSLYDVKPKAQSERSRQEPNCLLLYEIARNLYRALTTTQLSLMTTYRMSLISARSISLDSGQCL
jgi:hypothetical protein